MTPLHTTTAKAAAFGEPLKSLPSTTTRPSLTKDTGQNTGQQGPKMYVGTKPCQIRVTYDWLRQSTTNHSSNDSVWECSRSITSLSSPLPILLFTTCVSKHRKAERTWNSKTALATTAPGTCGRNSRWRTTKTAKIKQLSGHFPLSVHSILHRWVRTGLSNTKPEIKGNAANHHLIYKIRYNSSLTAKGLRLTLGKRHFMTLSPRERLSSKPVSCASKGLTAVRRPGPPAVSGVEVGTGRGWKQPPAANPQPHSVSPVGYETVIIFCGCQQWQGWGTLP